MQVFRLFNEWLQVLIVLLHILHHRYWNGYRKVIYKRNGRKWQKLNFSMYFCVFFQLYYNFPWRKETLAKPNSSVLFIVCCYLKLWTSSGKTLITSVRNHTEYFLQNSKTYNLDNSNFKYQWIVLQCCNEILYISMLDIQKYGIKTEDFFE